MFDKFAELITKAQEGLATQPKTAEEHAMRAAWILIQVYIAGQGPLAEELHQTVECLMNPEDPLVKDMPIQDRQAIQNILIMFRAERKKHAQAQSDAA